MSQIFNQIHQIYKIQIIQRLKKCVIFFLIFISQHCPINNSLQILQLTLKLEKIQINHQSIHPIQPTILSKMIQRSISNKHQYNKHTYQQPSQPSQKAASVNNEYGYFYNQTKNEDNANHFDHKLSCNFTVAARVKPKLQNQYMQNNRSQMKQTYLNYSSPNQQTLVLQYPSSHAYSYSSTKNKKFNFDSIFIDQSNTSIYEHLIKPKLSILKQNFNLTLLTYGITGSGKTHTIFGNKQLKQQGIAMMCINDVLEEYKNQGIYNNKNKDKNQNKGEIKFAFSYMQIYNQQVHDLLAPEGWENNAKTNINTKNGNDKDKQNPQIKLKSLNIMEDGNGRVNIPELSKIRVNNSEQVKKLIEKGNNIRACSSNYINKLSSRSHALLQLYCYNTETGIQNTITIIDLAGSQRHTSAQSQYRSRDKSKNKQHQNLQKQGSNINRSLLALGNCLKGLQSGQNHIPYRDSKLTRILKQDLSGKSHNIMIACVGRSYAQAEETVNTLQYASRAARIKVQKIKNCVKNDNFQCSNCFKQVSWNYVMEKMPEDLLRTKKIKRLSRDQEQPHKNLALLKDRTSNINALEFSLKFQIQLAEQFNNFKQQILSFIGVQIETQRSQYQYQGKHNKQNNAYSSSNCLFPQSSNANNVKLSMMEKKNIDVGINDIFCVYERRINEVIKNKVIQCSTQNDIENNIGLKELNHTVKLSRAMSQKLQPQPANFSKTTDIINLNKKSEDPYQKTMQLENLTQNCNIDSFRQQFLLEQSQLCSNLRKKISIKNNKNYLLSANTANSTLSDLSNINNSFDRSKLYIAQKTQRMNPDIDNQLNTSEHITNKDMIIQKLREAKNKYTYDINYTHQNMSQIQFDMESVRQAKEKQRKSYQPRTTKQYIKINERDDVNEFLEDGDVYVSSFEEDDQYYKCC